MDQQNNVRIDVVGSVDGLKGSSAEAERELDKMKGAAQSLGQEMGNLAKGALADVTGGMGEMGAASEHLISSAALLGSGFVAATVGMMAYAAAVKQGHDEQVSMDRALAVSGDYAGVTRGQMRDLADTVSEVGTITVATSKAIITELVSSGRIAGDALGVVAGLAENYAAATGQKIDTIAPKLVALFGDPAKGAATLNEQMHFLTNAQLDYIRTLEDSGRLGEAQLDLANRLADALPRHARELGALETVWANLGKAASRAWDAMLAVGREDTLDEKLAKAKKGAEDSWTWWRNFRDFDGKVAVYQAAVDANEAAAQEKATAAKIQQNEAQGQALLNSYSKTAKKLALAQKMAQADALLPDGPGKNEVLSSLRDQIIGLDKEKQGAKAPRVKEDPAIKERIRDMRDEARAELDLIHAREKEASALIAMRQKADDLLASYGRQDAVAVQRIARSAELASMSERERTVAEAVYAAQDKSATRQEQIIKQISDETERTRALNIEKDQLAAHIDKVTAAAAKSYDDQRSFSFGWNKAFQAYTDNASNAAATAQGAFQSMTSVLEDSLVNFATNTKYTFRDMAQSILKALAQVAAKQAAMGLVKLGMSAISGTWNTWGVGAQQAPAPVETRHSGGIVGVDGAVFRSVSPAVFSGAPKFHTGGIAGDEVPAILRKGEGVFTEQQMKALGGAGGGVTIQQVFNMSGGGDSSSSSGNGAGSMKAFADLMANVTKQVIVQEMRSGGMLQGVKAA